MDTAPVDTPGEDPLDFITRYLQRDFQVDAHQARPEATFSSLALDSIAQVELFVSLSDHYGVELDDSHASDQLTLRQTAELVHEGLRRAGGGRTASTATARD
ncbi:acyl carrier protein [Streptomyces sp. NPDC047097]|uniref:acyl carrier protein n=1 Tax=Streptomyces sp. NPDC047097 TaxID=3155260 RepID=UPI0033DC57C7